MPELPAQKQLYEWLSSEASSKISWWQAFDGIKMAFGMVRSFSD